jgi:hypothetical protein
MMFDLGYGYITLRVIVDEPIGVAQFECAGCRHRFAVDSMGRFANVMDAVVEEFGPVHTHP